LSAGILSPSLIEISRPFQMCKLHAWFLKDSLYLGKKTYTVKSQVKVCFTIQHMCSSKHSQTKRVNINNHVTVLTLYS